jgi:glycosyltransferase involved in cell wall biosynthesis
MNADLICLFAPDLLPWERSGPELLIDQLQSHSRIEIREMSQIDAAAVRDIECKRVWVLCKKWREAMALFRGKQFASSHVWISVFDGNLPKRALSGLMISKMKKAVPGCVRLLAHSPLVYRVLRELEGVPENQIFQVPFPLLAPPTASRKSSMKGNAITIGTFSSFNSEANLNYMLNVAHYVAQRRSDVRFRILGNGNLYSHLARLVSDLALEDIMTVSETFNLGDVQDLDIFLYTPLRNEHFIPVLAAAHYGLPVLSAGVPGIEDFILDGHSGFIVGTNETRPMGELLLRLIDDPRLRESLGKKLSSAIGAKYSAGQVGALYLEKLFGVTLASKVSAA